MTTDVLVGGDIVADAGKFVGLDADAMGVVEMPAVAVTELTGLKIMIGTTVALAASCGVRIFSQANGVKISGLRGASPCPFCPDEKFLSGSIMEFMFVFLISQNGRKWIAN